jgi:ParB-like nuclease domain
MSKETASLEPVQQNTLVPLTQLYGHARNYRQHPPEQIKKLKSSLERFGFVRSIVAQVNQDGTYTIVAGHGIVQAAQELVDSNSSYYERFGKLRTDVIPASWSPEQVSGYLLSDNQLSNDAQDDTELLAALLQEQQDAGFDLASVGSDEEALRQMLTSLGDEALEDEEREGRDIPGLDAPDLPYKNQFAVAVMCSSEAEQQTVFESLTGRGYTCKVLVV